MLENIRVPATTKNAQRSRFNWRFNTAFSFSRSVMTCAIGSSPGIDGPQNWWLLRNNALPDWFYRAIWSMPNCIPNVVELPLPHKLPDVRKCFNTVPMPFVALPFPYVCMPISKFLGAVTIHQGASPFPPCISVHWCSDCLGHEVCCPSIIVFLGAKRLSKFSDVGQRGSAKVFPPNNNSPTSSKCFISVLKFWTCPIYWNS